MIRIRIRGAAASPELAALAVEARSPGHGRSRRPARLARHLTRVAIQWPDIAGLLPTRVAELVAWARPGADFS